MSNPEHLAKLKEGVEAWNAWATKNIGYPHSCMVADLTGAVLTGAVLTGVKLMGADLSGADLSKAQLGMADLSFADLSGTNLREARLNTADLSGADLTGADLRGAQLSSADLHLADLPEANLSKANLSKADLSKANLSKANLSKAVLHETVFGATDLTTTKGLDDCVHTRESVIDIRTFLLSKNLPLTFLRGCGLSDHFIDLLPSIINQCTQYYSCFISYSSKDEKFAQRLYSDLQNKGVRCWYAPEDMKIGDKLRVRIDEVIQKHEKLLIVLSEKSIDSAWVEKEVETAFEKERKNKETVLFPIRLDNAVMDSGTGWAADIKRSRHIGDFTEWKGLDAYTKAFDQLLRDLKTEIAPGD